jgi:hypothetical protein
VIRVSIDIHFADVSTVYCVFYFMRTLVEFEQLNGSSSNRLLYFPILDKGNCIVFTLDYNVMKHQSAEKSFFNYSCLMFQSRMDEKILGRLPLRAS